MTIKEIAKLANTSRGTVDRVLNNRGKVSTKVYKRIMDVIVAYNYQTNEIGRTLSLINKKMTIGVIIGAKSNYFFNLILLGINSFQEKYKSSGVEIIVKVINIFDYEETILAIEELKNKINGLIITAIDEKHINAKINELNVPVVAVNIDLNCLNKICFVGCDYYNSGLLIANLIDLMNQNFDIGVVIGSKIHDGHMMRLKGLKHLLYSNNKIIDVIENNDDDQISFLKVSELIKSNSNINLLVFLGAGTSGGIKAIKNKNAKIKIICVDYSLSIEEGLQKGQILATITQHPYTQGYKAMEAMFDYIIKKKNPKPRIILDNSIILKESIIVHKIDS